MQCPACRQGLVALELDAVEVDWCAGCGGVWLDRGELELLHENPRVSAEFLSRLKPAAGSGHPSRKCPICSARLAPVQSAWNPDVTLDECPKRDGLWFDRDELARTLGAGGSSDRIRIFLQSIFKK